MSTRDAQSAAKCLLNALMNTLHGTRIWRVLCLPNAPASETSDPSSFDSDLGSGGTPV